jgi:hypothetical protein
MFGDYQSSFSYTIQIDPGADANIVIFRAPQPLTIRRVTAVSSVANGAGTAVGLTLISMGTSGTVNSGTVCAEFGGTAAATRFAAGVPQVKTTITDPYVAEGEYLGLKYDETSDWVAGAYTVQFDYVMGKGSEVS